MSRIDDLIRDLCPDGVERKLLGDVGEFIRGSGLQKKDLRDEGVGAIHYGQVFTHYGTSAKQTKSFVEPEFAAKLRRVQTGDLIIATTSENDVDVCKAVTWLGDDEIAVSGDAYIFRHSLSPKYVSYFFQSQDFQDQKRRFISGTKVRRVSGKNMEKIRIPVPPFEVQDEIVRILDNFSALTAELEARRAQYEYYRDALLRDHSGDLEDQTLDGVATFKYGQTAKAADEGDVRFIRITDINEQGKLRAGGAKYLPAAEVDETYKVQSGDVLIARTGASYGKCVLMGDEIGSYASFLIRLRFNEGRVLPEYFWHFAQSGLYWAQAERLVSRGQAVIALARRRLGTLYAMLRDGTFYQDPENARGGSGHALAA